MNNFLNILKVSLTVIGTTLGFLFGGFDTMLITLFFFMIADYITGIICAIKEKKVSSKVGYEGILKKILILILIIVTNLLGLAIQEETLRYLVISFYLANEGISILENCSRFGVPIPKKIKDVLEQLKETEETSVPTAPSIVEVKNDKVPEVINISDMQESVKQPNEISEPLKEGGFNE